MTTLEILRVVHVVTSIMWVGSLLAATRMLGYLPKEDIQVQERVGVMLRRMYSFVQLPTMFVSLITGMALFSMLHIVPATAIWLHIKLTCVGLLVVCDIVCGRFISQLGSAKPLSGRGVPFKILHGLSALLFIGIVIAVFVVRRAAH